jgi:hypothetical protein
MCNSDAPHLVGTIHLKEICDPNALHLVIADNHMSYYSPQGMCNLDALRLVTFTHKLHSTIT